MKNVVTALLVLAVAVLAVGIASHGSRVDLDYVAGTWHQASLLPLAAVVAALLVAVGVLSGAAVGLARARDRRALQAELERTYVRLRAAEAAAPVALAPAPAAAVATTADHDAVPPAAAPEAGTQPPDQGAARSGQR